jgi:hypothetical protein
MAEVAFKIPEKIIKLLGKFTFASLKVNSQHVETH